MGLFSGGNSSSSTQNVYNTDNTSLGAQASADNARAITLRGDNNNIEMLDDGAINSAFGFAERNASAYVDATADIVEGYGGVVQAYGNTSERLAGQVIGTSERLAGQVIDAAEGANQQIAGLAQANANDLRSFAQYQSQSESGRLAQLVQWGILAAAVVLLALALVWKKKRKG